MKSRLATLGAAFGMVLAVNGGSGYLSNAAETLGVVAKVYGSETLSEGEAVEKSIVTMVNAIDAKQWDVAVSQFDADVFVDYSSLSGQPGSTTTAESLVGGWENLLARVSTLHMLSNFDISVDGDQAEAFSHVYASHSAEGIEGYWDAYGRYHHKLQNIDGEWKITSMTLIMHGQKGNLNFLQEVIDMNQESTDVSQAGPAKPVEFMSDGKKIVGNLYLPQNFEAGKQYPAVIVSGSWTTVKEQMAGLYLSLIHI